MIRQIEQIMKNKNQCMNHYKSKTIWHSTHTVVYLGGHIPKSILYSFLLFIHQYFFRKVCDLFFCDEKEKCFGTKLPIVLSSRWEVWYCRKQKHCRWQISVLTRTKIWMFWHPCVNDLIDQCPSGLHAFSFTRNSRGPLVQEVSSFFAHW